MERRQPLDVTSIDDPVRSAGQKLKSTGQDRNRQPRADEGQSLDSPIPGAVARDMSEDRQAAGSITGRRSSSRGQHGCRGPGRVCK